MSRIQSTLAALQARREKALGLFLTCGFPDPASTLPILQAIDEAGADFIELGMPFSDPLAEGLPIQRSSERALRQGTTLEDAFMTAAAFRATSGTPLLLMGYINPIYRYGVQRFCERAAAAGVDGLILPDLPPEEGGLIESEAAAAGLDLVYLIAPNTSDARVQDIDRRTNAFIYAVSVTGLTGSDLASLDAVHAYLARAKRLATQNPILVGFGIKSHEDAMRLSAPVDGFIVGSALIQTVERLWDNDRLTGEERLHQLKQFVHALKYGDVVAAGNN